MASALTCDAEILLEAIREAGVMAFVDGSPVLETVHMWRLAAWWPFCTPAERKEARARLKAIGGALAGRVRGRDTSADTERTRAFVDEYLPILREHLLLLRAGDFDPKAKGRPAAERWRYRQLRDAKFPARDLTRRASDARGSAYAIMARRLGCDERHVRRLARA